MTVMKKLFSLFVALIVATALWASNTITYTATEKLTMSTLYVGETTFGPAITSHTFSNGQGTITCSGEITTVGSKAFYHCTGLTSVTIPNSVTTIGNDAFSYCRGLTSVIIPNSVTTIGENAFYECTGLTSVTIPNSVTTIGERAFYGCTGLTSVTIPNSVTTIGSSAFYGCSGLTKTNYTGTIADWCKIKFGNSQANPMYYSHNFFINDVEVKDLVIPEGVEAIGNYAFYLCKGLTSVTIPNSVTEIGSSAFLGCSGLTSVTIGNSVTTIGSSAFYGCSGLTSVTIPNSVTTIGGSAFEGCSGLTSITIPNSVTTIGARAFEDCTSLTSINVDTANTHYTSVDGVLFNYTKDTLVRCPIGNPRKEYTIPNSVTKIGNYAFWGCSGLTLVTIPNSVTKIGSAAFYKCSGLTSVTIGNSVTTIGYEAFYKCSGLTSITCYATTPPTCGSNCFYNVGNSIPVYVPARSVNAYKNASIWKSFTNLQANPDDLAIVTCNVINGTQTGAGTYIKGDTCILTIIPDTGYQFTQWNDGNTDNPRSFVVTQDTTFIAQIDIASSGQCGDDLTWKYGDGILVISGTGAMYDYTQDTAPWMLFFRESISSLVINNGCTSIGNYAFYGLSNKNFKMVDLPNGLEQIGQFAFANCDYLKTLYLGPSIEEISDSAFANDERLLYITCYAIEPPLLEESAFANYDVYLSVLCESQDEYKVSKGWKLFNKENVSCIGAEEKPITGDEVIVEPSADNATFTWPQNDQAAGYSIENTKDGIVFCTLTFNAQGQLIGIAFAPNRAGSRMLDAAVMTSNGWQFTVTGLDQASKYGYALDALNASKQSIKHYEGEFATDGYTSLEWVTSDKIQSVNKMLLDGHLYILRDGNLYTATGARVK